MTTSKVPSSFSAMNATSTSSKRLSGLVSGLDTDTLVQQLTSGTQSKIDKQMQNKQIALWRQQSYRQVTTALTEFKNKYFSTSSSSSNISSPSFFNSTSIKNTSPFLNVSGNADVAKNMAVTSISQLAQQASFTSKHRVSNEAITTGIISSDWAKSKVCGSSLTLNYGGKDYTVELSSDFALDCTKPEESIVTNINNQIAKIDGLKGNVSFSYDSTNKNVTLTSTADVTIKDGSENLLTGLGLISKKGVAGTKIAGDPNSVIQGSLFSPEKLADSLSGSTLTFSLNGINKNITFEKGKESDYSDITKLQDYLQKGLDSAFGLNNVKVTTDNKSISFATADPNSIVSIASCTNSGVLGMNGALHTYAGETNRINTNKTLEDVQKNLDTRPSPDSFGPLKASTDGTYGLKINDVTFTFKSTDSIANIISTINNDTNANVTIAYSTINDSFSVTAKNGGSAGRIDISNVGTGNLANVLFGDVPTKDASGYIEDTSKYSLQKPLDAKLKISFDGNPANAIDIVRSDNKFSLDGVNFELVSKTDDATVNVNKPIKFSSDTKSDELYTKVKSFVDDYNALIELTNNKVSERKEKDATYLPLTDAQKKDMSEAQITAWETKAKKGLLQGDSILNSLSLDLRHSMTDQVASANSALFQIGIASKAFDYTANGKLTINEETLKKALNDDPQKVAALFTGADGIATRIQSVIDKNIKTTGGDGILIQKAGIENGFSANKNYITKDINDFETKIKELKTRLETQQEQYYRKFTRLEQYLSTMNSQASLFTPTTTS